MGKCCSRSTIDVTDNDAENFMRDVINNLKARSQTFEIIKMNFEQCLDHEVQKFETVERLTVILYQDKYDEFLKAFIFDKDANNDFLNFHEKIVIDWNKVTNQNHYEFNFYKFIFSFCDKENKVVDSIDHIFKYNPDVNLFFSSFKNFLHDYLEINLIQTTGYITRTIEDQEENLPPNITPMTIHDIRSSCLELEKTIYNQNNLGKYKDKFVKQMENIILKNNLIDDGVKKNAQYRQGNDSNPDEKLTYIRKSMENVILTKKELEEFFTQFDYLHDALLLRNDFFRTYEKR